MDPLREDPRFAGIRDSRDSSVTRPQRFAAPSPIRHTCHEMSFLFDPNAVGGTLPAVSPGALFHHVAFRP